MRPENVVGVLHPGQVRLVKGRLPCEVLQTEPILRAPYAWQAKETVTVMRRPAHRRDNRSASLDGFSATMRTDQA